MNDETDRSSATTIDSPMSPAEVRPIPHQDEMRTPPRGRRSKADSPSSDSHHLPQAIDWGRCKVSLLDNSSVSIRIGKAGTPTWQSSLHSCILGSIQYERGLHAGIAKGSGDDFMRQLSDSATGYVLSVFQRINPQDPMEEMLLTQAVITHARLLWLNRLAMEQEDRKSLHTINEAADRAANTYRRQMLALREYRRPTKTFVAVRQANLANQQLIQNNFRETEKNATNEQGSGEDQRIGSPTPALPADSGGIDPLAGVQRCGEAMAFEHRPANGRRQGAVQDERPQARRAKRSKGG